MFFIVLDLRLTRLEYGGTPFFIIYSQVYWLLTTILLIFDRLDCIRYTGTSVNPARSIGPALYQGGTALSNLWIFIVGPFVGATIAAGIWKLVESKKKKQ